MANIVKMERRNGRKCAFDDVLLNGRANRGGEEKIPALHNTDTWRIFSNIQKVKLGTLPRYAT